MKGAVRVLVLAAVFTLLGALMFFMWSVTAVKADYAVVNPMNDTACVSDLVDHTRATACGDTTALDYVPIGDSYFVFDDTEKGIFRFNNTWNSSAVTVTNATFCTYEYMSNGAFLGTIWIAPITASLANWGIGIYDFNATSLAGVHEVFTGAYVTNWICHNVTTWVQNSTVNSWGNTTFRVGWNVSNSGGTLGWHAGLFG